MKKIWDIKLYETKNGYKVKIEGAPLGQPVWAVGEEAPTPTKAYSNATCKLVVKPWLVSDDNS